MFLHRFYNRWKVASFCAMKSGLSGKSVVKLKSGLSGKPVVKSKSGLSGKSVVKSKSELILFLPTNLNYE
jgi:hypothetical protein